MSHPLLEQSSQWTVVLRLALRNVLRQKTRTSLTVSAVALGVIGLILTGGFIRDTFLQLGEAIVRSQNGHLQIARTGFFTYGSRSPERFLIEDPGRVAEQVRLQPEVAQAMARLHFSGLLGNGRTSLPVICEGVEPDKEARLSTHLAMKTGRNLAAGDRHTLIAGEGVARTLGLKPGDTVVLVASTTEGTMNSVDFELVGVFQSFSKEYDARAVKIPLAAAQELFGSRGANLLVVELSATRDTVQVAEALRAPLAALGLELRNLARAQRLLRQDRALLRQAVRRAAPDRFVHGSADRGEFGEHEPFRACRGVWHHAGSRRSRQQDLCPSGRGGTCFRRTGGGPGRRAGRRPGPRPFRRGHPDAAAAELQPRLRRPDPAGALGDRRSRDRRSRRDNARRAVLPALRVSRIPVVEALRTGY